MLNSLLFNGFVLLPIIISSLIFFAVPIIIVVCVVKASKKNKANNVETHDEGENLSIAETIKNALNRVESRSNNICEYCGSNIGTSTECPNCGAKLTKKR